jgi:hypothetical protein
MGKKLRPEKKKHFLRPRCEIAVKNAPSNRHLHGLLIEKFNFCFWMIS